MCFIAIPFLQQYMVICNDTDEKQLHRGRDFIFYILYLL